jgi:hypothetical protein
LHNSRGKVAPVPASSAPTELERAVLSNRAHLLATSAPIRLERAVADMTVARADGGRIGSISIVAPP